MVRKTLTTYSEQVQGADGLTSSPDGADHHGIGKCFAEVLSDYERYLALDLLLETVGLWHTPPRVADVRRL
jgi:hypothetical protein